jgi:hypothetical protein
MPRSNHDFGLDNPQDDNDETGGENRIGVKVLTGTSNPYVDPSPFGRGRVIGVNWICVF